VFEVVVSPEVLELLGDDQITHFRNAAASERCSVCGLPATPDHGDRVSLSVDSYLDGDEILLAHYTCQPASIVTYIPRGITWSPPDDIQSMTASYHR